MSMFAISEHKARSLLCLGARWWHVSSTCLFSQIEHSILSTPSTELWRRLKFKVTGRHLPSHCHPAPSSPLSTLLSYTQSYAYVLCLRISPRFRWRMVDVSDHFLHSIFLSCYHPFFLRILISFPHFLCKRTEFWWVKNWKLVRYKSMGKEGLIVMVEEFLLYRYLHKTAPPYIKYIEITRCYHDSIMLLWNMKLGLNPKKSLYYTFIIYTLMD